MSVEINFPGTENLSREAEKFLEMEIMEILEGEYIDGILEKLEQFQKEEKAVSSDENEELQFTLSLLVRRGKHTREEVKDYLSGRLDDIIDDCHIDTLQEEIDNFL